MTDLPYVCLVDAVSSGSLFAEELRVRGFRTIHVQTGGRMPRSFTNSFTANDHAVRFAYKGDIERTVADVARYKPVCVIPGMELGVPLADKLSERLGLATNGTALSAARRDKREMQQRISAAGLAHIPTHRTAQWDSAAEFLAKVGRYPVVLKPPASAGTDNVYICASLAEAKVAFDAIMGSITIFDGENDACVLQPHIDGEEWMINSASCAGHHVVTDIWAMRKFRGSHPLYDYGDLVASTGNPQDQLVAYAWQVLDALGIRFGAAHMELFLTGDGPVLIEVGARLDGQKIPALCQLATGYSQVTATLDAYLAPERFFTRPRPEPNRHVRRIELIAPRSGVLKALPRLADTRSLPSFHQIKLGLEPGQPISETISLMTVPGYIDLIHPDANQVERDYASIRTWERSDFYQIE